MFILLKQNRSPMKDACNDILPFWRWEHRATIAARGTRKARVFMAFIDNGIPDTNTSGKYISPPQIYIEEITPGGLELITDNQLFDALYKFLEEKNLLNILPPMPKRS